MIDLALNAKAEEEVVQEIIDVVIKASKQGRLEMFEMSMREVES